MPVVAVAPTPLDVRRSSIQTSSGGGGGRRPGGQRVKSEASYRKISTNLKAALIRAGRPEVAERVDGCGLYWVKKCPGDGCGAPPELMKYACGHKLCGRCAGLTRWRKVKDLWPLVRGWKHPRFLTLTFKSRHRLRRDWIRRQMACLRAFLEDPNMKQLLRGGIWTWEVTYNQRLKMWHPHFHILYDGAYLREREDNLVSGAWFEITGDSFVVDVRDVIPKDLMRRMAAGEVARRAPTEAEKLGGLRECVKYITKAVQFSDDEVLTAEFLDGTKGMRRHGKFGHAYRYKPPEKKLDDKRFWNITRAGWSYKKLKCGTCGNEAFAEFWLDMSAGLVDRRTANEIRARGAPFDDWCAGKTIGQLEAIFTPSALQKLIFKAEECPF